MSADRVLLIQLRQIGDVVLTTPIARILKEARPGCRVSFLTETPSHELLEGNPYIDEVLLSDRRGNWARTLGLGTVLRRKRFRVVLDFMANPRSAILSFLSGAPMRISYPAKGRGVLYTHRVAPTRAYAVEIKKRLLAPLDIENRWRRPEVFLTSDEAQWGRSRRTALLGGGKKRLVTVDPSHRRPTRRWPAEHYGELCRDIEAHLGALPVVLWGPGEGDLAREVAAASGGRAIVAPPTGLRELAALIAAADLHVGNCSAPRHIALAVGTPSFTVLGSTSRGWTYPDPEHFEVALGLECQPCNRNQCDRNFECLREFTPARVFEALSQWVDGTLGWCRP